MLPSSPHDKPDYGIDAPGVVRNFAILGGAGLFIALVVWIFHTSLPSWWPAIFHSCLWPGLAFVLTALIMLWGSKIGKLRFRNKLINSLNLQGIERVLDVGCGRGLLVLGIAKKLTTGRAVGIDLWQGEDQSGNAITTTEENARRENVVDKVELHTGDMRELPFQDASFDVIVSSWAIHNIADAAGRHKALMEIVRVLKPGGQVALVDIRHTLEYQQVLQEEGMVEVRRVGPNFLFVIPTYMIWGRKPKRDDYW